MQNYNKALGGNMSALLDASKGKIICFKGCLLFILKRFVKITVKLKRRCFRKRALGVTETCKKSYYYEYESSFYRMRRRQHEEAARNNRKAGARNKRLRPD